MNLVMGLADVPFGLLCCISAPPVMEEHVLGRERMLLYPFRSRAGILWKAGWLRNKGMLNFDCLVMNVTQGLYYCGLRQCQFDATSC